MTKDGVTYFDGQLGRIFRYLMDYGPATATQIAQNVGVKRRTVSVTLSMNSDIFVKVAKVPDTGRNVAWQWSVWEE